MTTKSTHQLLVYFQRMNLSYYVSQKAITKYQHRYFWQIWMTKQLLLLFFLDFQSPSILVWVLVNTVISCWTRNEDFVKHIHVSSDFDHIVKFFKVFWGFNHISTFVKVYNKDLFKPYLSQNLTGLCQHCGILFSLVWSQTTDVR